MVTGGQKMTFKGHAVTPERIDAMEDAEIEELHAPNEARLGAAMSKLLGFSLLCMYASFSFMITSYTEYMTLYTNTQLHITQT